MLKEQQGETILIILKQKLQVKVIRSGESLTHNVSSASEQPEFVFVLALESIFKNCHSPSYSYKQLSVKPLKSIDDLSLMSRRFEQKSRLEA
jgi:hypothetical protein